MPGDPVSMKSLWWLNMSILGDWFFHPLRIFDELLRNNKHYTWPMYALFTNISGNTVSMQIDLVFKYMHFWVICLLMCVCILDSDFMIYYITIAFFQYLFMHSFPTWQVSLVTSFHVLEAINEYFLNILCFFSSYFSFRYISWNITYL